MKAVLFILGLSVSFVAAQAQEIPKHWVYKLPPFGDSLRWSKERLTTLSTSRTTAIKEKKNILVFPATMKETKNEDASYFGGAEKREVYKVSTPAVVSRNISETEKNLDRVFTQASRNNWVLFFDGADSLFSNSTQPESTANYIQKLAQSKNVLTIFWCEDDCLKWLGRSRYVLVQ